MLSDIVILEYHLGSIERLDQDYLKYDHHIHSWWFWEAIVYWLIFPLLLICFPPLLLLNCLNLPCVHRFSPTNVHLFLNPFSEGRIWVINLLPEHLPMKVSFWFQLRVIWVRESYLAPRRKSLWWNSNPTWFVLRLWKLYMLS